MIGFLALVVAAGFVWGLFALFRVWIEVHRRPGRALQEVVKPPVAHFSHLTLGVFAAGSLMVLMSVDPLVLGGVWWLLLLAFSVSVFEVACWSSELYQFSFHEGGLWYGHRWYPFQDIQSYEIDPHGLLLVIRGRKLRVGLTRPLSVELRMRLAVEGWA